MYDIKLGTGCGVRLTLLTASGAICDLRSALYYGVSLRLPDGSTIKCDDTSLDRVTNTLYTKLRPEVELTKDGVYGIFVNVKMLDNTMYSTAVVNVVEVSSSATKQYDQVAISLSMIAINMPDNIEATGASPYIGPNQTWLVYDDTLKSYKDTGIAVTGKGEQGESGVHVGSEEPTDDSNVWIDPEGDPRDLATKEYVDSAKEELFRDLWNYACGSFGRYNEETGYYELNGLTDITYDEAVAIYNWTSYKTDLEYAYCQAGISGMKRGSFRTNLPRRGANLNDPARFSLYITRLEVLNTVPFVYDLADAFNNAPAQHRIASNNISSLYYCQNLKRIIGNTVLTNTGNVGAPLGGVENLEEWHISKIAGNCAIFSLSPKINYISVKWLIDNAANTAAIVVTVHADTMAKLEGTATDDKYTDATREEWMAIVTLATSKNISFAIP